MLDQVEIHDLMDRVDAFASSDFTVATAGYLSINETFTVASDEDIVTGETIGIPTAVIVLAIVFGADAAPLLPLAIGIAAIAISLAAVALIGQFAPQQVFIANIITVLGLAVGIDYAHFIVDRYREFRARGSERREAIELAGATASKSVVVSAGTVIFALAGLWLVPNNIFRSLRFGAVIVVAATVLVSLTLLPAMPSLVGDRINWPRKGAIKAMDTSRSSGADAYHGFWERLAQIVMARPIISAVLATGVLILLALPVLNLNTGVSSGEDGLPPSTTRDAVAILEDEFSAAAIAPVRIVFKGERVTVDPIISTLINSINNSDVFVPVTQPVTWNTGESTAILTATLAVRSNSEAAFDAVADLREDLIPSAVAGQADVETWVIGESAVSTDMLDSLARFTPWVFAFVLTLSFLLLTLAFRSTVLPFKAILMNLLSTGASYGLMVLVFQEGFLIDLFGFQRSRVIESWIPQMLFSILFGLSMDYHIFLLSRIRIGEHFDLTGRNRESVAIGLRSTARIITGAALIMVAVFGGMAAGQVSSLQQLGFGLAVAVLIDATVIRSVLVPSTTTLLGKWNWYLPSWLNWLPDLRIEGLVPHPVPRDVQPTGTLNPSAAVEVMGN